MDDTRPTRIIKGLFGVLVVEELIGQGVNPVTGDYSRGAVGHWVENGEIKYPVPEITIAGNLRERYQRIVAIGNDQDLRGGMRGGSLLVEEMTIAGARSSSGLALIQQACKSLLGQGISNRLIKTGAQRLDFTIPVRSVMRTSLSITAND